MQPSTSFASAKVFAASRISFAAGIPGFPGYLAANIIACTLYACFGRFLVETLYAGDLFPALTQWLRWRHYFPLEIYYAEADRIAGNTLLAANAAALAWRACEAPSAKLGRWIPWLCAGASFLPFLWVAGFAHRYHIRVPYQDSWEEVWIVGKWFQGELKWQDLWAWKGDHRIFLPRLATVLMASGTRWSMGWMVAVTVLLAVGVWVSAVVLVFRSRRRQAVWLLLPAASAVVFSLNATRTWIWGESLVHMMCLSCAMGGLAVLGSGFLSWKRLGAAALLGLAATFSFAAGFVVWPSGAWIIGSVGARRKWTALILWGITAALAAAVYLQGYSRPEIYPAMTWPWREPLRLLLFALMFLGSPVEPSPLGAAAGLAGLAGFSVLAVSLARRGRDFSGLAGAVAGYTAFGLFSIGAAVLAAAGRAQFGPTNALMPHYVLFASPLWLGLLGLSVLSLARNKFGGSHRHLVMCGAALTVLLVLHGSVRSAGRVRWEGERANRAAQALYHPSDDKELAPLYPDPGAVRVWTEVLRRHRLTIFHHMN